MTTHHNGNMEPLAAILAVGPDGVIGRDGKLPWHHHGDLAHFQRATDGRTLLVGRRTYETLPPLQGRRLVVVSATATIADSHRNDIDVAANLDAALRIARRSDPCPIIAGGAHLYRTAWPLLTDVLWTQIEPAGFVAEPGDIHLGDINLDDFELVDETELDNEAVVRTFVRREVRQLQRTVRTIP